MKRRLLTLLCALSISIPFATAQNSRTSGTRGQHYEAYQTKSPNTTAVHANQYDPMPPGADYGFRVQKRYCWNLDFLSALSSDDWAPDMFGINLTMGLYLDQGCHHKLTASIGILGGDQDFGRTGSYTDNRGHTHSVSWRESVDMTSMPLLLGYTFTGPISKYVGFYVSVQGGCSFNSYDIWDNRYNNYHYNYYYWPDETKSDTNGMLSAGAGIRIRLSQQNSLQAGWEFWRMYGSSYAAQSGARNYNVIRVGFMREF